MTTSISHLLLYITFVFKKDMPQSVLLSSSYTTTSWTFEVHPILSIMTKIAMNIVQQAFCGHVLHQIVHAHLTS
jgi:hypothetical protein